MLQLFVSGNPSKLFFESDIDPELLRQWFTCLIHTDDLPFAVNELHSCSCSVSLSTDYGITLTISGDEDLIELNFILVFPTSTEHITNTLQ